MNLTVNGRAITIEPLPGEMLADLLRNRLGLTGTKIGCNEAECGACTVLVDGVPVLSCTYPAAKAEGKSVVTIEGLADLAPQQESSSGCICPAGCTRCRRRLWNTARCSADFASRGRS